MVVRLLSHIQDIREAHIESCLAWFPAERAADVLAVKHVQGRREKVAAYLLLMAALEELQRGEGGEADSVETIKAETLISQRPGLLPLPQYGQRSDMAKPLLANYPEAHFNISHCKQYVAVAVSRRGAVGVDVECRRRVSPLLLQKVCSLEEQAAIAESEDTEREFLRHWTRKEAYLKCIGTGIRSMEGLPLLPPSPLPAGMGIRTIALEDGYLSVCWECEPSRQALSTRIQ